MQEEQRARLVVCLLDMEGNRGQGLVRLMDTDAGVDGKIIFQGLFVVLKELDKTFQLAFPFQTPEELD